MSGCNEWVASGRYGNKVSLLCLVFAGVLGGVSGGVWRGVFKGFCAGLDFTRFFSEKIS